ncbi:hypothetical protein B0T22DRAFT_122501 [Podospora appendiculata]|uniref:Uncharacterized protein n=1 Tax=Podospora appendiculata TaxID=314037 RepID=A0AAE1CB85_9PEZI|nr:hypothetical protein B0T22DRAFT_122501 [Podospora appendiculata]
MPVGGTFSVERKKRKCNQCNRLYQHKHTCWGLAQRRPRLQLPLVLPPEPAARFQLLCNALLGSSMHSPQSQRVLANLEILVQQGIRPDRIDIVKLLVLASKAKKSAIGSRERLIGSAQVLLGENAPLHLQTEVVQQRSTLMRLNGNIEDSIRLIDEFISRKEIRARFRRTPRASVGSCLLCWPHYERRRQWLPEEMRAFQGHDASKGYRRILLSLVEVEIRLKNYEEARHHVEQLLPMFNSLIAPDIVDRLGHVRTLMAAARVSGLDDAEKFWSDALYWNNFYNHSEEEVFTCGVIYMYMCLGQYKLGKRNGSREYLECAQRVFGSKGRQFLIPGVGTYLVDFVVKEVDTLTGWNCGI